MTSPLPTLAVFGGTGNLGWGLALRWARAGHPVIVGSRTMGRAAQAAAEIAAAAGGQANIRGLDNRAAAAACEIGVMAVPFAVQRETAEAIRAGLQGKILVDVTVPLVPPRVLRVQLPEGGSAVAAIQALLGKEVRVVSAFQNIAAAHLRDPDRAIECDVLVCGDDKAAREQVIALTAAAGLRGWHAGPIANSAAAEAMTSVLMFLNRTYGIDGAGLRITGTPAKDAS